MPVFSAETLRDAYREAKFPCRFCSSCNKKNPAPYLVTGTNPSLGNCNYGLGHIYPVGQCYPWPYPTTKAILDYFFPVGSSTEDWLEHGIPIEVGADKRKFQVRQSVVREPERAKKYRDALLFRLIHPCNHFFAPGLDNQRACVRENAFLILTVREMYQKKYPDIYKEFEEVALYRDEYVILNGLE